MVSSDYTVSSAAQLMGRTRISGSTSKSGSTSDTARDLKVDGSPAPERPLRPLPVRTISEIALRSKKGAQREYSTKMKLKIPSTVNESEAGMMNGKKEGPESLEGRMSQYFEYITPPISHLARSGSRREKDSSSHTPTSSGGSSTDIYFSPIDATKNSVFLSSPQPTPPVTPAAESDSKGEISEKLKALTLQEPLVVDMATPKRGSNKRKVSLTLAQVDRLTTALAATPLVQKHVRRAYFDELPSDMSHESATSTTSSSNLEGQHPAPTANLLISEDPNTLALIDTTISGCPVIQSSASSLPPGHCTHLAIPYGVSHTSKLRISPPESTIAPESRITLQTLHSGCDRKTGAKSLTLLVETDLTHQFQYAALAEFARGQACTLDDVEILTPVPATPSPEAASSPSIDWANLDGAEEPAAPCSAAKATLPTLTSKTCTPETRSLLTLLSAHQTAHSTFMLLRPSRFDASGLLIGVKIPLVSGEMRVKFAAMDGKEAFSGRKLREAVIATVTGVSEFAAGGEFETAVGDGVKVRCVPVWECGVGGAEGEGWVCVLEFAAK